MNISKQKQPSKKKQPSAKWFVAFAVALSSCNSLPDIPDVSLGAPISQEPIEESYIYFVPVREDSERSELRMPLVDFLDSSMVCMSADDYAEMEKWIIESRRDARRCRRR